MRSNLNSSGMCQGCVQHLTFPIHGHADHISLIQNMSLELPSHQASITTNRRGLSQRLVTEKLVDAKGMIVTGVRTASC